MALLSQLIEVYTIIVIVRVVLSWMRPYPASQLERMIYQVTEPALAPIRQVVPAVGGFDLSPLVLIFLLQMVGTLLGRGRF